MNIGASIQLCGVCMELRPKKKKKKKKTRAPCWNNLRHFLVLQIAGTKYGTPQRVIEYKTKMVSAQTSEVYIVGMVKLIKPVKTLA